jgi:hypothetical protein
VQPSCLACYGPKDERPAFVKKDYPEDRAYSFEDGDLRGIYAVLVPDTSATDAFQAVCASPKAHLATVLKH